MMSIENKRLNICFVCCEYPPGPHGGVGTFTQVLSRALVAAGHTVRVTGVYQQSYPAPDYEEDNGVQVWRLRQPKRRLGWLSGRFALYRQLSKWAHAGEIDLIELPDWQGWAAKWPQLPVPVIVRLNGSASYFADELDLKLKRTTFWLERASMRRADYWCSVSRYTAERTKEVFDLKSGPDAVLYNPIEAPDQSDAAADRLADVGNERSKFDVVFTGTLAEKKGVYSLFRAWPQVLQQTGFQARLHLYGKDRPSAKSDSMMGELRAMLDESQLQTVQFHGHAARTELFQAIRKARLAVFPSYAEAFALAPLEAMALGCPTIYSQRGSGRELVDHGIDGLLIDPDSPADIAENITRLIKDDSMANRIGTAGQRNVLARFTDQALLGQNIDFYQRCVRHPKSELQSEPNAITATTATAAPSDADRCIENAK